MRRSAQEDGMSLAYRRGIPLENMEIHQFHSTGLRHNDVLLSEGAKLLNGKGEYFMKLYMPNLLTLP